MENEKKYSLFDPENGWSFFNDLGEIKNHIKNQDFSEGYPEESFLIYQLKEFSVFEETDNVNNYKCIKNISKNCICKDRCDDEDRDCEDADEWPYSAYIERVGEIGWIEV